MKSENSRRHTREEKIEALGRVIDTLDRLRVECPWDRKQTNASLRPNSIEEMYELSDALLNDDTPNIAKELGDVLLHILFYAKIGEEKDQFDIADVADKLNAKLIFRHPHVFGDAVATDAHGVELNWEQIKLKEKGGNRTVLEGVPNSLPSLIKAYRIQEKAANSGFDWEKREDVWQKVKEEIGEFEAEARKAEEADTKISEADRLRLTGEMGDLIFSLVNASRLYKINPDTALELTNAKFIRRFNYIEQQAAAKGIALKDLTLGQMEELWQEAKSFEKSGEE
ncbi:MAG: nucleoside triphosphate pyrophosphohydrolase [Paramuribaculum sp.]|nr:nucleoside triphosphate pyrophosphohydrolase [Paramuribaculum sp.]MDE6303907.1 nucleoside triphosphate pyrophosphohydrolase [Paramuribaculum sp.]